MKQNTLNEIINFIGKENSYLINYLIFWIKEIENSGITIYTRQDQIASSYENKIIRISTHESASKEILLLWDLLHEYGHYLDSDETYKGYTPRELRAWNIAYNLIKDDEFYKLNEESFHIHKNLQLQTYRLSELNRFFKRKCEVELINGITISGEYQTSDINTRKFCLKTDESLFQYSLDEIKKVNPIKN